MVENTSDYDHLLKYLPEKEKIALKEAQFIEDDIEDTASSVIKQVNRKKQRNQKIPKRL